LSSPTSCSICAYNHLPLVYSSGLFTEVHNSYGIEFVDGGNMFPKQWAAALCAFVLTMVVPLCPGQTGQDARISTIQTNLNRAKAAFDQLPNHVKAVAYTQRRLAHLADMVNQMGSRLGRMSPGQPWSDDRINEAPDENGLVRVNNPARDFRFSNFVGYTQSESAIARCGQSVVVAFDDTGSILETLANGTAGIIFRGAPLRTPRYTQSHS
jgi:hypothetical protein